MKLEFDGLFNTRDLGGLKTKDGRKIKLGRVIRSDNLSGISENDILKLQGYGLKKIVDFRTDDEITLSPDKDITGCEWIKNPILEKLTTGITRKEDKAKKDLKEILLQFSVDLGPSGVEWLRSLYIPLVNDPFCLNGYRAFLNILRNNKEGAVLYHCSAGKDRVGVGTMIFLSILGVDREDIKKDYLLTNESYRKVINQTIEYGRSIGIDEEILATVEPLSGVDISYLSCAFDAIDSLHGGMENFFKNQLNLDKKFIDDLRNNYLET